MGSISNDFVTIEYETEEQELNAKKYIEVFNLNKVLYKGILNGKTIIHSDELICLPDELINSPPEALYYCVANNILESESINRLSFSPPKPYDIITGIFWTLLAKIEEVSMPETRWLDIYSELAYYYCIKENDFKYMNRYLFDKKINFDDIYEICKSIMLNHYNELIKEEIEYEETNYIDQFNLSKDYDAISKILPQMLKYLDNNIQEIYNSMDLLDLDESTKSEYTYKLSNKKLEKLVIRALEYIDHSGNLLKEYETIKREDRIHDDSENIIYAIHYGNHFYVDINGDYGISLYPTGCIRDFIDFMHEYGHLHEYRMNKESYEESLLSEFFSIYIELKSIEFIVNCEGYQKEIIDLVESFRTDGNLKYAAILYPLLINNKELSKNEDDISYFDNLYPEHVKSYMLNTIFNLTCELGTKGFFNIYTASSSISNGIKYFLSTYLATYAVNNLTTEEVLSIIKNNDLKEKNIYEVLEMFGINLEELSSKESKVKLKSKKKKTK